MMTKHYDQLVNIIKSLRLVAELHTPQEITLPDGSWGINCKHCDGWEYPCKTMIVVADGLNICLTA